MPRARNSEASPSVTVRQSPRKRKLDDGHEEATTPSNKKRNLKDRTAEPKQQSRKKTQKADNDDASGQNKDVKLEVAEETHLEDTVNGVVVEQAEKEAIDPAGKKSTRKRKTKEEKESEAMPLAARSTGLRMFVGAHVSIAKGVENSITNIQHIGGNALALFLKSQRKWENPPLKDENRDAFREQCSHLKYDSASHVVPHGSYLVNLATPHGDKAKQSYDTFVDDLRRCEALGIRYYNFHPGATNQEPLDEAIDRLSAKLNQALSETSTVVPLLENMAGSGSVIGSRFTDLRDIIARVKPEFKDRIGVCLDTCHTVAAGYDLRTPEAYKKTMDELDETVGLKYLKALHMNDSKAPLDSKRDLHQNIGLGFLGLRAFHNIMNDKRLENLPMILETPCDRPDPSDPTGKKTIDDKNVWAKEIKLLESLIGMDPESEEFKRLERELSEQGRQEREKMAASIATRDEKASKKAAKERGKNQKSVAEMSGKKNGNGGKKKGKKSVDSESELSSPESDS